MLEAGSGRGKPNAFTWKTSSSYQPSANTKQFSVNRPVWKLWTVVKEGHLTSTNGHVHQVFYLSMQYEVVIKIYAASLETQVEAHQKKRVWQSQN